MSQYTIFLAVESVVRKKSTSISNDVAWLKCSEAAEVPGPWPDLECVRKQKISAINNYPMLFQSLSFMVITLLGIIKQTSLLCQWNKFMFRVWGITDSPVLQNLFSTGALSDPGNPHLPYRLWSGRFKSLQPNNIVHLNRSKSRNKLSDLP